MSPKVPPTRITEIGLKTTSRKANQAAPRRFNGSWLAGASVGTFPELDSIPPSMCISSQKDQFGPCPLAVCGERFCAGKQSHCVRFFRQNGEFGLQYTPRL